MINGKGTICVKKLTCNNFDVYQKDNPLGYQVKPVSGRKKGFSEVDTEFAGMNFGAVF